nr:MAG TPA: hypothetical protein [Caudoviricetes sp.]
MRGRSLDRFFDVRLLVRSLSTPLKKFYLTSQECGSTLCQDHLTIKNPSRKI